ncbi:MAG TPA: restriction endonuclease subunit S [Coleofasciculaceae cyanobacterium]|jgi:type I restriction enzyme S subunit
MSQDWESKKLSEICSLITDGVHNSPQYVENGIPMLDSKHINDNFFINDQNPTKFISQETDILLSKRCKPLENDLLISSRGSIGKIAIVRKDQNFNIMGNIILLRVLANINSRYIAFSLKYKLDEIQSISRGVAQKGLYLNQIRNFEITLPPFQEQKRIVAIVDEAFEGIDRAIANTEKNLTNARELFESYLNATLSGQGKQWKETTLGKEIDLLTGFAFKSSGYTDSDKSIRLLRGDNIAPGSLRWDGVKRWPESEVNEYLYYQLQEGDVVLAMDRPWIKTGLRRAQITKDDLPCLLVQRTACLRGDDNLENRFLLYLISGRAFTQHVLGSQTGLSVPHISGKQIQSFEFSKPSLREQYSIIDSLDELKSETKRLEAIYQQKITALNELKQSILQKAFTGELTADITNQATKTAKEVVAA